jgi:hypothetical protein
MNFQELNELPGWLKTCLTLVAGAGGAKMLSVWLENHRLEKKDYRETLLTRIRELEVTIKDMQSAFTSLSVKLALVQDENLELREKLERQSRVHRPIQDEENGG